MAKVLIGWASSVCSAGLGVLGLVLIVAAIAGYDTNGLSYLVAGFILLLFSFCSYFINMWATGVKELEGQLVTLSLQVVHMINDYYEAADLEDEDEEDSEVVITDTSDIPADKDIVEFLPDEVDEEEDPRREE